jgi:hypothetical protein
VTVLRPRPEKERGDTKIKERTRRRNDRNGGQGRRLFVELMNQRSVEREEMEQETKDSLPFYGAAG